MCKVYSSLFLETSISAIVLHTPQAFILVCVVFELLKKKLKKKKD